MSQMLRRRIGKYLLAVATIAIVAIVGVMAVIRRDHTVELLVTYAKSPPRAVWRLLTDHAAEPNWLPAFATVTRRPDIGGHEVWTHTTGDGAFSFTVMTVLAIDEQRYERILLRDNQPRNQSWDGRWIYELQPHGNGTLLRITEYGWTDGFPFFIQQRVLADPDAFLKFYAAMIGQVLNDPPSIEVLRSH
jgi:uncharacterized protein YndB with AHSA1/START domain